MAIAPLYLFEITMTVAIVGGIVGIISIIAHHYITNNK
jgi:hypothetical protein